VQKGGRRSRERARKGVRGERKAEETEKEKGRRRRQRQSKGRAAFNKYGRKRGSDSARGYAESDRKRERERGMMRGTQP